MKIKVNKYLLIILFISAFLGFYKLENYFSFIGDQGWFYVSARDLIIFHEVPLVGITASHTWLHQGALWTYMLVPALLIFKYSVIAGSFISIFFQLLSVAMVYLLTKAMFKKESIALITSFLIATSPLMVIYSRMSYHTSPITFLTILFVYTSFKYLKGNANYLIYTSLILGFLYSFELATMALWIIPAILILITKKINLKLLFLSLLAFLIPNIPMIIFDLNQNSGLYQLTAFIRLIKISIFNSGGFSLSTYLNVLTDLLNFNQKLVFILNPLISIFVVIISFGYVLKKWYSLKNKKNDSLTLIILWIVVSLAGIIFSKSASGAYLPMIVPGIIVLISYFLGNFLRTPGLKIIITVILFSVGFINVYTIIKTKYFTNAPGYISFQDLKISSKNIVAISENKKYNLIRVGSGSEFKDNYKNYEYLSWFYGNGPSRKNEKLKVTIEEKNGKIFIKKHEDKF